MKTNDVITLNTMDESLENFNKTDKKTPSLAYCPVGKHLVREHVVHVHPSKKHPHGIDATWHEHCANNPSHKDELSFDELQLMAKTYFNKLSGPPTSDVLKKLFPKADDYDVQIRGWVQYWNDIFQPSPPLDPNLIKALIATESGFHPKPRKKNGAHGLMQITNLTFHVLSNTHGELKDHLIRMTQDQLVDPSANICAGVRWLYWKKATASMRLHRTATWEEAIIEYKDYWKEVNSGKDPQAMQKLRKYYKILQGK